MRRILLLLVPVLVLIGCAPKRPQSFVLDGEQVLTPSEHRTLDSLFRAHEASTGNEVVLVTDSTFDGKSPLAFATDFGNLWGVGKRERNNGVVIAYSGTRRSVFIATGLGTEHVLTDSTVQHIVDHAMIPRFKEGDTFGGLWAGSSAVVEFLERPENAIR